MLRDPANLRRATKCGRRNTTWFCKIMVSQCMLIVLMQKKHLCTFLILVILQGYSFSSSIFARLQNGYKHSECWNEGAYSERPSLQNQNRSQQEPNRRQGICNLVIYKKAEQYILDTFPHKFLVSIKANPFHHACPLYAFNLMNCLPSLAKYPNSVVDQ